MSFKFSFSSDDERRQFARELDQFIDDATPVNSTFSDGVAAPVSAGDVFLLPDQSLSIRLGDAIEKLLLDAPLVWASYDREALSASEAEAQHYLVEAGLIEQQYFQIRRSQTSDFGFYVHIVGCGESLLSACREIESKVDPLLKTDGNDECVWIRIPPRLSRLTSEGELARKELLTASKRLDGRHVKRSVVAFVTGESIASGKVAGTVTATEPIEIWWREFEHATATLSAELVTAVIAARNRATEVADIRLTDTDRCILQSLQAKEPQTKTELAKSAVSESEASGNVGKSLDRLRENGFINSGGRGRASTGYTITDLGRRKLLNDTQLK